MQISSHAFYDMDVKYTVKLNEDLTLVVGEDLQAKETNEKAQKKAQVQETQEEQKSQDESQKEQGKITTNPDELTEGEEQFINDLASRDAEVRAHEAAHQAAGGGMVGPASYTYQKGPDGRMYAIGGDVPISIPAGSTPEEAISNARQAAAAAMAPGDPSPQDYAVASSARIMEMQAQQQKTKEILEETQGKETYSKDALSNDNTQSSNKEEQGEYTKFDISA